MYSFGAILVVATVIAAPPIPKNWPSKKQTISLAGIGHYKVPEAKEVKTIFSPLSYYPLTQVPYDEDLPSRIQLLADYLKEHPALHLLIEGRSGGEKLSDKNIEIANDRAYIIYKMLVDRGIEAERMRPIGFERKEEEKVLFKTLYPEKVALCN